MERVGQVSGFVLITLKYFRKELLVYFLLVCLSCGHLQYLKDEEEDLVSPPSTKGNQWLKFLQESKHLNGEIILSVDD